LPFRRNEKNKMTMSCTAPAKIAPKTIQSVLGR
jgi:hypothetical protein